MLIAVTSRGTTLESEVDPRFGRAAFIIVVETDDMSFEVIDNSENVNSLKGAGIQAASLIAKKKAAVLLTGHCGPNAFKVLKAAGITVANNATGSVREAVSAYLAGELPPAEDADVEGHW